MKVLLTSFPLSADKIQWLNENTPNWTLVGEEYECGHALGMKLFRTTFYIQFQDEIDAVLYKLRWP
jgi:hypothetical protein